MLDRLGLSEYKETHPMSLSGGQKQRVTIVLALLSDMKISAFDEPTSSMDHLYMIKFAE